jgi:hypothetical protein
MVKTLRKESSEEEEDLTISKLANGKFKRGASTTDLEFTYKCKVLLRTIYLQINGSKEDPGTSTESRTNNDKSLNSSISSKDENEEEMNFSKPILIFDVNDEFKSNLASLEDLITSSDLQDSIENVKLDSKKNLLVYATSAQGIDLIMTSKTFFGTNKKNQFQ